MCLRNQFFAEYDAESLGSRDFWRKDVVSSSVRNCYVGKKDQAVLAHKNGPTSYNATQA